MQTIEIKIEAFGEIERLLPKPLQFEFAKESLILDVLIRIILKNLGPP